ncbi:hypothetical protein LMH73_024030 [Vibrio splendidus]|nr:hypothetical protein [Vibrio splendidus]MCC4880693.1 hypothetical protein [Vibrio splendidus]
MSLHNAVCKETPHQNGVTCFRVGMSIHANPFRNTGFDHPLDSFTQWKDGWKKAKTQEVKAND